MNGFRIKNYQVQSHKIHNGKVRLHFISDLHGLSFGADNCDLLKTINMRKPDLILLGGDMMVSANRESWETAAALVRTLRCNYPLVYAMGNHEMKTPDYMDHYGLYILQNDAKVYDMYGNVIRVRGLDLERKYFQKPFSEALTVAHIRELLGSVPQEDALEILLAHNPYYGDTYFDYGSDMILSGHYHGGVVRFTENIGLVSTQFHPFPRYCCGRFDREGQTMIVSGGLGEHTISFRLHNPRELIEIDLLPLYKSDTNK